MAGLPLEIARDHPAFAGHFPGQPIVPGVVILAEALAAIERATGRSAERWEISQAKFLKPVGPGEALALHHEPLDSGSVRVEIRAGEALVANGVLAPRAA